MRYVLILLLIAAVAAALILVRRDLSPLDLGQDTRGVVLQAVPGGDAERGRLIARQYGCGSCHVIPGVVGASGAVGPPLTKFARRTYIAGALVNTPENLVTWIANPQQVEPGTAMPDLGIGEAEARHIAAYLATLR